MRLAHRPRRQVSPKAFDISKATKDGGRDLGLLIICSAPPAHCTAISISIPILEIYALGKSLKFGMNLRLLHYLAEEAGSGIPLIIYITIAVKMNYTN